MKKLTSAILIIAAALFIQKAHGQQADSLKQARIKYMSKDLAVTETKAQQIVFILDEYKENAKLVINDKSLNRDALRVKLDVLIDEKNMKLKKILTEEQSNKLIPTTERRGNETSAVTKP